MSCQQSFKYFNVAFTHVYGGRHGRTPDPVPWAYVARQLTHVKLGSLALLIKRLHISAMIHSIAVLGLVVAGALSASEPTNAALILMGSASASCDLLFKVIPPKSGTTVMRATKASTASSHRGATRVMRATKVMRAKREI
eukprot:jgi/Ulvmu1/10154/UM006_0108.1